jgi:hypothetical protein
MTNFTATFWQRKGPSLAGIMCAAMLSSTGAFASPTLFGMATVTIGMVTLGTPVEIDPITGVETQITPGTSFTGNPLDVVASGNTLYAVSPSFPTDLDIINVTTGDHTTTVLSSPIMDMTVDPVSGKLFGMATVTIGMVTLGTPVEIDPVTGVETPPGPLLPATHSTSLPRAIRSML